MIVKYGIFDSKTTCFTVWNSYDIKSFNIILVTNSCSVVYRDNDIEPQK